MKKFFVVLLSLVCLMSFTACDPQLTPEQQTKLLVEATTAMGDMTTEYTEDVMKWTGNTETGNFTGELKEALTLKSGIKITKYTVSAKETETYASSSMAFAWVSKIDNKKHELNISMSVDPSKPESLKSSTKLDGKTVDDSLLEGILM